MAEQPIDVGSIYSEVRVKLDKLDKDLAKVDAKFNALKKQNEKQTDDIAKQNESAASKSSKSWLKSFTSIKLVGVGAFIAITKAIKDAVKIGAQFGQSIANVGSVTNGTADDLERLKEKAKEAGETTRFTASQAADALYSLASAGLDATQSIEALDGVLQFAGATGSDLATSSALVVSTLKQYGLQASEAGRISNVLAAGIGNSLGTMDKFRLALEQAGPVAGGLNIQIEETVGALEALFDAGYKGEKAGTALRNIYSYLADSTSEVSKKLVAMGADISKLNPEVNSLADITDYLNELGLDTGDIFAAFGNEVGGQMVSLLKTGGDAIREYTKEVTGTNAAAEMYAKQNDTLAGSFDKMKSALQGVAISITEILTPGLRGLMDWVAKVANKINGSNKEVEESYGYLNKTIGDLETATKHYNDVLVESEGKTDAVTQAIISQAKAARDLALQKTGDAYSEANEELDNYNKTIETSQKWIDKYNKNLEDLARGTGYTTDQLNKMSEADRNLALANKGIDAIDAYNTQLYARLKWQEELDKSNLNLNNAEAKRATFIDQLTAAYLQEDESVELLLNVYPELRSSVLNNVDAYKKQVEEQEKATEAAKKELDAYINNENARLKASQSFINLANARIKTAKSSEEALVWEKLLAIATDDLNRNEEASIKTAEELAEEQSKRAKILEDLNNSIIEANQLEQSLGDNYDLNSELSGLYLKAIEDLIKNGEDPHSDKLKELISLYEKYNGKLKDSKEKTVSLKDTISDYRFKLASIGATSEEVRKLEQKRAIDLIKNSDASIAEIVDATHAVNEYYKALANEEEAEKAKEIAKQIKAAQEQIVQEIIGIFGNLSSLFSALSDRRMAQIDAELQAELKKNDLIEESTIERLQNELAETQATHAEELALIDAQIAAAEAAGDAESAIILKSNRDKLLSDQQEVESEQQKAIDTAEITAEYEKKKAQEKYKYDMFAWGASLTQATAENAVAILKTMSSTPFPWNIGLAAAQGVAGGVQLGVIAANKPQAPALATGGVILPQSGGVLTRQAENGFGEVDLNMGPSGEPLINSLASRIASIVNTNNTSASKDITIYLQLTDSKPFSKAVVKDINDGIVRVKL